MSLILDALRRADSERERGAVPGLHAQPVPVASPEPPPGEPQRLWFWLAAAAGVGLLAVVAWLVVGRELLRQTAMPSVSTPPTAPAPPVSPRPPAAQASVAAAPSTAMEQTPLGNAPVAAPAAGPAISEPRPVAEPAPWPAPEGSRQGMPTGSATAAAAGAVVPPAQVATSAAPAAGALPTRDQLPENIRSQLPPLVVGGSIYSPNPGDRSVIIDGRLLRESERLSVDLALEEIRSKSAVLRFKGYRFEISL